MMEALSAYIPMDRRQALISGQPLPNRQSGAALNADISGFTPLTEALAGELGPQRGAEEMTDHLARVYGALIAEVHRYGGSVIGFSGDAITCWFDEKVEGRRQKDEEATSAFRAVVCGLAMQALMQSFATVNTPAGTAVTLAIKVAITVGPVRRFLVGDPQIQRIDVLAGKTMDTLSIALELVERGEVVLATTGAPLPGDGFNIQTWREDAKTGVQVAVVTSLVEPIAPASWPEIPAGALDGEQVRPWLLPAVYNRLRQTANPFLADLRPVAALFLSFSGLDYDEDDDSGILLDAFIRRVQATVSHYEGVLLQLTMGDKGSYLYAAFGAPFAHADDAVRAVAAALDLRTPPANLSFIRDVRIGVTHGQVYTGAYGAPIRRTYGVLGDKVNLAARLMQLAEPGEILADDEIYRHARNRWGFITLPSVRVKGKAGLIRVYQPTDKPATAEVEEAAPLVGRAGEVARLEAALAELQAGKGRVIFIEGEAGIGKSRLVAELVRLLRARGLTGLLGTGQSIEQQTPYRAWRDIFTSFFDLDQVSDLAERQLRVTNVAQELVPKMMQRLPLLNDVLNLNLPDTALTGALDPSLRQESLVGLLIALLRAWAQERPLILVLEDAHWLDSVSWSLALQAARAILLAGEPLLLVVVNRPLDEVATGAEQAAALRSLPDSLVLSLDELNASELVDLVAARLGIVIDAVPQAMVKLVQERAGGNPFFAEELIDTLIDQELITVERMNGAARCLVSHELTQATSVLPDTLQGLILARIDRLPPDRQFTLKVASVIGRTFAYSPLQATLNRFAPPAVPTLPAHLQELAQRHLTLKEATDPELTYIFKHIITHEVAYQTLLFAQRKEIHRAVAEWYERVADDEAAGNTPEVLAAYLPLLVHHYHHAEDVEKERHYAWLAGQQAAERYANDEAGAYLSRALELGPPNDPAGRYELLLAREKIYDLQGVREAQLQDLRALERLAEILDDNRRRAEVLLRLASHAELKGEYQPAVSAAQLAASLAQAVADTALQTKAMIGWGRALWKQARYAEARPHLERALALSQVTQRREFEADCLSNLGIVADLSGDRALARSYLEQCLAIRRQIGNRDAEGSALNNLGVVAWRQGNLVEAQAHFEQALQIYREIGSHSSEVFPLGNLAMVVTSLGDYAQARTYAEQAVSIAREIGDRYAESRSLGMLAKAHTHLGNYLEAFDLYQEALKLDRKMGDRQDEVHKLGNLGYLSLLLGDQASARTFYEDSLHLSRQIGDRDAEMYASRGLCLLFHQSGDDLAAVQRGEETLQIAQAISDAREQSIIWTYLGHARVALGQLSDAGEAYQQALELLHGADDNDPAVEVRAGLARLALRQGDVSGAMTQVEVILPHLQTGRLNDADERFRVHLTCYQVLLANNDSRAQGVLAAAVEQLQAQASRLEPERRHTFLENVPAHRELLTTWINLQTLP
ncbi:MAG TPA: tetratricopeptide repeat protein [Anaerolineae bacterium]